MTVVTSRRLFLLTLAGIACRNKAEPPPSLGRVPAFTLTDHEGRPFTRETLANRVWVAAFMFTRCPTICPRITRRMRELQQRAKAEGVPLVLVSFTVDAEHDTPSVLKQYAAKYDADLSSWSFVTGDSAVISKTAIDGFKLAVEGRADPAAPDFGILHGSHLVLVDAGAEIRGFYRTDDPAELARLLGDVKLLA